MQPSLGGLIKYCRPSVILSVDLQTEAALSLWIVSDSRASCTQCVKTRGSVTYEVWKEPVVNKWRHT